MNSNSSSKRVSLRASLCGALLLVLLAPMGVAQKPKTNPLAPKSETPAKAPEEKTSTTHDLTQNDLEAFLTGLVPLQIAREDIAGAVISVVKDRKLPTLAWGEFRSGLMKM